MIGKTVSLPVDESVKRRERKKAVEMAESRGIWAGGFLGRKEETSTRFDTQHRRSIGSLGTHHLDWGPLELNYSTTKEYAYGIGQVARQPTREQELQNCDLRIQASTRTAKLQLPKWLDISGVYVTWSKMTLRCGADATNTRGRQVARGLLADSPLMSQ